MMWEDLRQILRSQLVKSSSPKERAATGSVYFLSLSNPEADHGDYLSLLRKIRKVPGVKSIYPFRDSV